MTDALRFCVLLLSVLMCAPIKWISVQLYIFFIPGEKC